MAYDPNNTPWETPVKKPWWSKSSERTTGPGYQEPYYGERQYGDQYDDEAAYYAAYYAYYEEKKRRKTKIGMTIFGVFSLIAVGLAICLHLYGEEIELTHSDFYDDSPTVNTTISDDLDSYSEDILYEDEGSQWLIENYNEVDFNTVLLRAVGQKVSVIDPLLKQFGIDLYATIPNYGIVANTVTAPNGKIYQCIGIEFHDTYRSDKYYFIGNKNDIDNLILASILLDTKVPVSINGSEVYDFSGSPSIMEVVNTTMQIPEENKIGHCYYISGALDRGDKEIRVNDGIVDNMAYMYYRGYGDTLTPENLRILLYTRATDGSNDSVLLAYDPTYVLKLDLINETQVNLLYETFQMPAVATPDFYIEFNDMSPYTFIGFDYLDYLYQYSDMILTEYCSMYGSFEFIKDYANGWINAKQATDELFSSYLNSFNYGLEVSLM